MLIVYGIVGALAGWAVQYLRPALPRGSSGNLCVAALFGIDGAFAGAYIARRLLSEPGQGAGLFLAISVAFVLLSSYRFATSRISTVRPETCNDAVLQADNIRAAAF